MIVTIIALFLLACAALGAFLWQRQQEENQLEALRRPGLLAVGAPAVGLPIHSVEPLEDNVGVVIRYAGEDGEPHPGLWALNLRAGTDPDLCALLARAQPEFAAGEPGAAEPNAAEPDAEEPDGVTTDDPGRCEAAGNRLTASLDSNDGLDSPEAPLLAEGDLRAATLVVLVADPADATEDELTAWVTSTDLTTIERLVEQVG